MHVSPLNGPEEEQILERLKIGLRNEAIRPFFQPELDFSRSDWMGFEALSRWIDPQLGEVSPAVFIPLAEKHQLLAELTRCQIMALQQAAPHLCRRYRSVSLAFNLSPRLIGHPDVWDALTQTRKATAELPLTWEVEITESEPIADFDQAEAALSLLRQQGIKVVLDDPIWFVLPCWASTASRWTQFLCAIWNARVRKPFCKACFSWHKT
jgi:EAL domain-containing protein (putative c-di-GMP-specific phosphodiesterase class I)